MHPLLERQLRQSLSSHDPIPEDIREFVEVVDETYARHDEERLLLERSLFISSEEYEKKNAELEERIDERKRTEEELKKAKDRAEESSRLKDKFVSLVSHDLRTPFASILGLLRLLRADTVHPLHEDQKALLQHVLKIGEGLVNMIDRLLDVGKLKTGKIRPNKRFVDASDIVAKVAARLEHSASDKNIKLVNEVMRGSRIYTDADLYGEVLHNLVSNAIKFSRKDSLITIFLSGDSSSVAVRDSGDGLKAEDVPKLFQFEEKTSTPGTEGEPGFGLGLPFSMDIMKALGGSIDVEVAEGGSVFTAVLPKVKPLIMIVDDDSLSRILMKESLEPVEADVIEADNGDEALAILTTSRPHLIIVDINMPLMDGFELLDKLKERADTKNTPVIVITSDNNMETRERAFRMGAVDFCGKPPIKHDFLPRVRRLLE